MGSKWLAAAIGFLALNWACSEKHDADSHERRDLQKIDVLIDWQAEPTYIGVYYAKAVGLFREAGYDVTIVESWGANQAVSAVAAGQYSVGTAAGGATVLGVDQGKPVVSTAVLCQRLSTVIYGPVANGISHPEDLYGKRIGMYAGSITVNEYEAFAKICGLDRSKIKESIISGSDIPLLKAGSVDAVLNYRELSPALLELDAELPAVEGRRLNCISLAEQGVRGYGLNVIANKTNWERDRGMIAALTSAIVTGYKRAVQNPSDAVEAFLKCFPEKKKEYIENGWKIMSKQLGDQAQIGSQSAKGWQETIDMYRALGLVKGTVRPEDVMVDGKK